MSWNQRFWNQMKPTPTVSEEIEFAPTVLKKSGMLANQKKLHPQFKIPTTTLAFKHIQLKLDQTERLLNEPYVIEVHLTGQNLT